SSTTSIVTLVGFNLVPLIGVLAWGWGVSTILVLYWVENGIVGLLNVPKILLAQGDGPAPRAFGASTVGPASKAATAAFFVVHYGVFWVVHGIFVFTLPLFAEARDFATSVTDFGPGFGVEIPLGLPGVVDPAVAIDG